MEEHKEEESLLDLLKKTLKNQEEEKKKGNIRKWKLPLRARVGPMKRRKNWVGVIQVNENKGLEFYKVKIDEGIIESKDKTPHVATPNYMLNWRRRPVMIVPSWSTEPFDPSINLAEAEKNKTLSLGYRLLKNHLEKGQIQNKKSFGGFGMVIILVIVAAVGYYAYTSGAFG